MRYKVLSAAQEDPASIREYIAEDDPVRALTFVQELRDACQSLAEMPRSAPKRPQLGPNIRMRPVGNYNIYYRPVADGIEILRVLHAARDVDSDAFSS